MIELLLLGIAFVGTVGIAIAVFLHLNLRGKPAPVGLTAGDALPDFRAEDEQGNALASADLRGKPTVMLFVRGNWCPFCNRQVEDLTQYYKQINDLGARLIFVTPKALDTTRRVAKIFDVEFDFWLDPELAVAQQLGLVHKGGVPGKHREQFGEDTVWPTALVIDADGTISYVQQSRRIVDRPDPEELVAELQRIC